MSFKKPRASSNHEMSKAVNTAMSQKKSSLHVLINAKQHKKLKMLALGKEMTVTEVISDLIDAYIRESRL